MADMLTESSTWHRDLRPAEIQKSDRQVCETKEAIFGFTNPFTISVRTIFIVSHLVLVFPKIMRMTFYLQSCVANRLMKRSFKKD